MQENDYQMQRFQLIQSIAQCRDKARELRAKMGLPDVRHPVLPSNDETDPVRRMTRAIEMLEDRLYDARNEVSTLQRRYRVFVHSQAQ